MNEILDWHQKNLACVIGSILIEFIICKLCVSQYAINHYRIISLDCLHQHFNYPLIPFIIINNINHYHLQVPAYSHYFHASSEIPLQTCVLLIYLNPYLKFSYVILYIKFNRPSCVWWINKTGQIQGCIQYHIFNIMIGQKVSYCDFTICIIDVKLRLLSPIY